MTTGDTLEKSTGVTEICPSGDAIFVAGPEETRYRVSSAILRNASEYFRALLGPHFSEGQHLSEESPKEIRMPEDDAYSLEVIFNVLHLRNEDVPRSLDPEFILDIAIAADKFNCIVALQHAGTVWLRLQVTISGNDLGCLMTAASVFNDVEAFTKIM